MTMAVLLWGPGCQPERASFDAAVAPSTPSQTAASAMTVSKLRPKPVAAGYGGVGPATPAPYPDVWIVLLVDLETTTALREVTLKELQLVDDAGKVVARAAAPWSLRRDLKTVTDGARKNGDFSDVGTIPFDGVAEPGRDLRLRVHAPLDTRSDSMGRPATRFRAFLVAPGDRGVWLEGPLQGPWATG